MHGHSMLSTLRKDTVSQQALYLYLGVEYEKDIIKD